jgi:AcrR family transcriptional regulator
VRRQAEELTQVANRAGQATGTRTARPTAELGRKGKETRRSLMQAARVLIEGQSPLNITAAAISKQAGTSPATFYVYFDNVEDVLWTLCDAITDDTADLFTEHAFLRDDARLEDDALTFVRGYSDIWARHGPLMLYRNMEADRGNKRFYQLVLRIGLPILEGLTDRIVEREPTIRRADANAEAVVFIAAIDRVASSLHRWPKDSLMPDVLLRAEARVLTRMLRRG